MMKITAGAGLIVMCAAFTAGAAEIPSGELDLRARLNDQHALGADHWIYNDFEAAKKVARKTGKPIFVTFRCVPCEACSGFDAEVAKGSELIKTLAQSHFVCVRQVEMEGVDLTQFQFDYDLNWAAMFLNADGTVYGRYGTQSAEGPDAYNSIVSLEKAMLRALDLHRRYPEVKEELSGKRGPEKPYDTALEMPGLPNKERLRGPTRRDNCVHCHNIHDAEQIHAQRTGEFTESMLWRFPLPDNVGIHIDPDDGRAVQRVEPNSPAAESGIKAGDIITHANGQVIISIADIQWVLDHLSAGGTSVTFTIQRGQESLERTVHLEEGWKRTDISWRGSIWSLKPRLRVWAPVLSGSEKRRYGLPEQQGAMRVKWINRDKPGGRAAYDAGLREGDLIVGLDGEPLDVAGPEFQVMIKLNYEVGDTLPLMVLRDGEQKHLDVPLTE